MSIETVQNETQKEKWLKMKSAEHHWAVGPAQAASYMQM